MHVMPGLFPCHLCTQAGDPAVAVQVIAIRADDPRAAGMEDVEDVERCALCPSLLVLSLMQHAAFEDAKRCCVQGREMPGLIERIREWFRDYKTPDGKPQNRFAFDNKPLNKEFTMQVWPLCAIVMVTCL